MDVSDRERSLRRKFGPPTDDGRAPGRPRSRLPRPNGRVVATLAAAVVLAAAAAAAFAVTPRDHVAPGCFWWTARTVGTLTLGQHGCVRGVVTVAGSLAESADADSPVMPLAFAEPGSTGPNVTCPFRPGDAAVIRYHTAFDDGRTFIVVDACR